MIIDVFSPANCLAILILPVFLLFYESNQAINNGATNTSFIIFSFFRFKTISRSFIEKVILFLGLEVGGYLLLLFRNYKKDVFYYITIITAVIAPFLFFNIGEGNDFCMRFSIPTVITVMVMCLKYLVNFEAEKADKISKYICVLLCSCLVIGAVTPMTEFFRGYNAMLQNGKIANVCDDLRTFDQDVAGYNFVTYDYKNSAFFKYLVPDK